MLLKIERGIFWILVVCLMPEMTYGEQRDILPPNADYVVEIFRDGTWEEIFVYNARVSDYVGNPEAGYPQYTMGVSLFTDSFREPLKVRVTRRSKTFSKVEIRPLSYGITPTIQTSNSIEFELDDPTKKVSVEFDGNRMENLFILPDRPDVAIPTGSNVTYFGPGVHNVGVIHIANEHDRILYLDEGAVVLGRVEAEDASNLTIRGRGIFCSSQENHGEGRRPQMEFRNCDNLRIEGILLRDTPNWTLKIVGSTGVHIDNIKEIGWIMNSDGMDFICCRNVLVENTFQRNYDDNVTIKAFNATPEYIASRTNADGSCSDGAVWMVAGLRNFEVCNYEIRNCVFWADKAHNMLVGPEARGIAFRNIRFHNNIVLENRQDDEIYPGAMAVMIADNGTFEDISFENIIVEDINGGKVFCAHFTNAWAFGNLYGQWARNITLRNISYTGTRATPSWIRGRNNTQLINGVTIGNFSVNGIPVINGSGPHLEINEYVRNVVFE
ncbi:glycosyl hydrolase family 28 protein [Alistipes sp.]|uniref:glycosyl hydrolase family 28 protein n=1 Tax=Alistipes sp. TaxID=1872444 RepID=UPI0025BE48A4|nr:glycosyl hydrolase family 28 protein [Alistipes sp.]